LPNVIKIDPIMVLRTYLTTSFFAHFHTKVGSKVKDKDLNDNNVRSRLLLEAVTSPYFWSIGRMSGLPISGSLLCVVAILKSTDTYSITGDFNGLNFRKIYFPVTSP